jgi:hypothetical protein
VEERLWGKNERGKQKAGKSSSLRTRVLLEHSLIVDVLEEDEYLQKKRWEKEEVRAKAKVNKKRWEQG